MKRSRTTAFSRIIVIPLILVVVALAIAFTLSGCASGPQHYKVYSFNQSGEFGTMDVDKGKFTQIGPDLPEGATGLALGPTGMLLTLGYSGTIYSIDFTTGKSTTVGATGLVDCIGPASAPCLPNSSDNIAVLGSSIYVTDMSNNLYSVNSSTGKATLVGSTGIPPALSNTDTVNPDGTLNGFDFTLFSANGKLYATSGSSVIDFTTSTSVVTVPAYLYQIDPTTAKATKIAPTTANLTAAFTEGGTVYAYYGLHSEFVKLSLTDGSITKVSDDADPSVGPTFGAYAVPVP